MALNGFSRVLAWSDFQGEVPDNAAEDAETITRLRAGMDYEWTAGAYSFSRLDVDIVLKSDESWSKTDRQSADLLRHEQGHYDITAIIARSAYNQLVNFSARKQTDLTTKYANVVGEAQRLLDRLQSNTRDGLYDIQTAHGTNVAGQTKWNLAFVAARASETMTIKEALKQQGVNI